MKKFIITLILVALFGSGAVLRAQNKQDYLGLPGDNLNLYAVMDLFQKSKTLEEFEKSLNDQSNNINNLDLNNDNMVDYIKVIDNVDGNVHNIVLQVAVSPSENQDVAVFTVQRFNNGQVQIQLTGDEELYGKNYIIEPITDNAETPNPGYNGQAYVRTTTSEIAVWPVVRYIYMPNYTVWHSSWYWGYYPTYWHPWNPFSWNYYYGYHHYWNDRYYSHYRMADTHRYDRWNDFYFRDKRAYSPEVNRRIETGIYKSTYSHPDQRKQGEELFARKHPEQYKRVTERPSGNLDNNISRRPASNMSNRPASNMTNNPGNKPLENSSVNRRQPNTTPNRPVTNTTVERKTVTTRTPGANNSTNGNINANRKPESNVNNRPAVNNNVTTTHKTTTTVTNKTFPQGNGPVNNQAHQGKSTGAATANRKTTTRKVNTEVKKDNNKPPDNNKNDDSNHRR